MSESAAAKQSAGREGSEQPARYRDRSEKAAWIAAQYGDLLKGLVLDVGAAEEFLQQYVENYTSMGLMPGHDIQANFENPLPLPDASFDAVLCIDVLEHVNNLHQLFDELCRVTRRHLIVSLPNPYRNFVALVLIGEPMRHYGLPVETPSDRHRWFFSGAEARRFFEERGARNGMRVVRIDRIQPVHSGRVALVKWALRILPGRRGVDLNDLFAGNVWAVLEKSK